MATLTFDTHKFIQALETTGFSRDQAEGLAEALKQIQEEQRPVTQEYLDYRLKSELAELKLDLIKWVTGALVAQAPITPLPRWSARPNPRQNGRYEGGYGRSS